MCECRGRRHGQMRRPRCPVSIYIYIYIYIYDGHHLCAGCGSDSDARPDGEQWVCEGLHVLLPADELQQFNHTVRRVGFSEGNCSALVARRQATWRGRRWAGGTPK